MENLNVTFADLTYTSKGISNSTFPFGISLVASYIKKVFGDKINIDIFQYPSDFIDYLNRETPHIVCFANYSWTIDISNEFAKKIKEKFPNTITVFGGPNFPLEDKEVKEFLKRYDGIDFYIRGEGEEAFVYLLKSLEHFKFNKKRYKEEKIPSGNCYFLLNNELIAGKTLPRIKDLDKIPSPYLEGILDKFFDGLLTPITQTVRGCPFACSFCQEGSKYFQKVSRFSRERAKEELIYIAKKVKVPNLVIADSNFGMYNEDIETCEDISDIKETLHWPKYIEASLGKNRDTVLKSVETLKGGAFLGAPVQSTDPTVLKNIHRNNISNERIIQIVKKGESYGGNSFSEVILALPGDTIDAHFKSMCDMINIGINVVRAHQLLILPGSEISSKEAIIEYKMKTKFRVQPKCFGNYTLYDEIISCAEIDEICVENSTMPYQDYLKCREFDLSVEIFYNNGIFHELKCFLEQQDIKTSEFIRKINKNVSSSPIKDLYEDFIKENENCLWDTKEDLEKHIKTPYIIDKYIKESLRENEQLKFRAIAFFYRNLDLHKIAFESAKEILRENGILDERTKKYLNELFYFSLLRKKDLLDMEIIETKNFSFNFLELLKKNFEVNPFNFVEDTQIEFYHTSKQKELFKKYLEQFGSSENDLGRILSRSFANKFYREVK